jgi:thioredoxin reductase (NADPH)
LMESGRIATYFGMIPTQITPSHVTFAPWQVRGSGDGESVRASSQAEFDFVLLQIGYEQDTKLLELAGVELRGECRAPVFDERTMETNVPAVYVAGTTVGGTQDKYRVFIENCHVHVGRIVAALTGAAPPAAVEEYARPET